LTTIKDILVPDLGGADVVEVIEIEVKPGDQVNVDDSLVTLESDKASMDIPSPYAGTIKTINIRLGDKLSEGDLFCTMEVEGADAPAKDQAEQTSNKPAQAVSVEELVPDLGTDEAIEIIEINVKAGDQVEVDTPLMTLESDKASMEIPSTHAGTIEALNVKLGDKVKQGDSLLVVKSMTTSSEAAKPAASVSKQATQPTASKPVQAAPPVDTAVTYIQGNAKFHAGPSVRRLANQLGVELSRVQATGRKGRIVLDDIHRFVKSVMQGGASAGGSGFKVAAPSKVDFKKFGDIELKPLSKIKKLTGAFLHRNWVTAPHVTQFNDADITDMEAFRKENKKKVEAKGAKLTPLVFIMKAVAEALAEYPQFNASLDETGENLILKKYCHIGVAVDTPNGLVVPVIRDVNQKSFLELSIELGEISKKARDGKLRPIDMQGGCFSISSLGGIGGTAFTPIVNMPEVAILGVSRSEIKPKYIDGAFQPKLMLPLSLSYDHRVIDGADAARFIMYLSACLTDIKRLLI
jgi:pyruvate dehydrogenase E2 component (dihydrolipoamide acetyltransferase)